MESNTTTATTTNATTAMAEPNTGTTGDNNTANTTTAQQVTKTFTQEDINRIMAEEKRQGKASAMREVLKELGVEDVKSAKDGMTQYKVYLDSQKTELQKATETAAQAQLVLTAMQAENAKLQATVKAIASGVKPECAEDVIIIATTKTTDDKPLDKVVEEMKANPLYESFFVQANNAQNQGTGNNYTNTNKTNTNTAYDFGKRLGEMANNNKVNKQSSYFK